MRIDTPWVGRLDVVTSDVEVSQTAVFIAILLAACAPLWWWRSRRRDAWR